MLTNENIALATDWLKSLPRHMLREHIKRAHQFGNGSMHSTQAKDREVLQQAACLAEAILQLLEEKEATLPELVADRREGL